MNATITAGAAAVIFLMSPLTATASSGTAAETADKISAPAEIPQPPATPPEKEKDGKLIETAAQKQLRESLEKHIAAEAKEDKGVYVVRDSMQGETWRLQLVRVDTSTLREISKEEYIVRAEFVGKGDDGTVEGDVPVALDFTLIFEEGEWQIYGEAIYSVNGKARFTYSEDHRRIYPESEAETKEAAPGKNEEDAPIGAEETEETEAYEPGEAGEGEGEDL